jgi:hypothetical protein
MRGYSLSMRNHFHWRAKVRFLAAALAGAFGVFDLATTRPPVTKPPVGNNSASE